MDIVRTPDSGTLAAVGYDSEQHSLVVEFRNGAAYLFLDVPSCLYLGILESESAGRFFNEKIRESFAHKCLRRKGASTPPVFPTEAAEQIG